jgi:DNA-nicking Smr family endonuclease
MAEPSKPAAVDEAGLFRQAMADVTPLPQNRPLPTAPRAPPKALFRLADEAAVLHQLLHGPDDPDLETGEDLRYLRPGVPEHVLRQLRRGRYTIQAEMDLHGLNRQQAREALNAFLQECRTLDLRCVRIIHGKGRSSPHGRGVLKAAVNGWLTRCDQVLAFCSARPADGGTGAIYVLLRRARG